MKGKLVGLVLLLGALGAAGYYFFWPSSEGPRILVLNSYHKGHPWTDDVTSELRSTLQGRGVGLAVHYMEMIYADSGDASTNAGRRAQEAIKSYQPDLLVTIDDPAVEHVVAPFYRDGGLPVVFAGLNQDAAHYGLPTANVTGIVENDPLFALLDVLHQFSGGASVALLAGDTPAMRRTVTFYQEQLGITFNAVELVSNFRDWQAAYSKLQDQVDVLYLHDHAGIAEWDNAAAVQFAHQNAVVPSGSINSWMAPLVLFVFGKDPSEHATWAANAALSILHGRSPRDIKPARSSRTPIVVNSRMAQTLLMDVPVQLIQGAPSVN